MKVATILKTLFGRNTMSKEEIQAAIDRSLEHMHQIRSPEASGVTHEYLSFLGQYSIDHPDATAMEAHQACMKAHPEYWPRTLPQKPAYSQEPAYSHN